MSEKEIWDYLEDLKSDITDSVTKMVKWYLSFSFGVIILLAGFIGWTAKEAISTKAEVTDVKKDFGTSLLIAPTDHFDAILYDQLVRKYNPTRGK